MELENLSVFSADQLAESYFEIDEYADELKEKLARYEYLMEKTEVTEAERAIESLKKAKTQNSTYNTVEVNADLKYDWENLFLSCAHCNNIKLGKYEPIIDCTKEDVEEAIRFRKEWYFGTEEEEKEDLKCLLQLELKDSAPFAAFKRWLIRDNKNFYPELAVLPTGEQM